MSLVAFNVYEPPQSSGDRIDRAERLAFIKDGFHWMAALFPIFWMPIKGLWIELLVLIVGMSVFLWGLEALGAHNDLVSVLILIVQIVIGFEAADIQAAALERRDWRMAGTVAGRNREECEARFLAGWLPEQRDTPPPLQPLLPVIPPSEPPPSNPPTWWPASALYGIKESLDRGRRLART